MFGILLAGGESRRMGSDKANLLVEGEPLWKRQLRVLQETGCDTMSVSAPTRPAWLPEGISWLNDDPRGKGPIGGLLAALEATSPDENVLLLAVDLPYMTPDYLRKLAGFSKGAIPKSSAGFEPLAAVYSKRALEIILGRLDQGFYDFQGVAAALTEDNGISEAVPIEPEEMRYFLNWNYPSDVPAD